MSKFIEYLEEADKITKVADHLLYMTYPIVRDKKILIKIITELKRAVAYCVNAILQYEYISKRIQLFQDPKINFKIFKEKSAPRFKIEKSEIDLISELFSIAEMHKKSSMEFSRNEKLVILDENSNTKIIEIEKIKKFLELSKKILGKIKVQILR